MRALLFLVCASAMGAPLPWAFEPRGGSYFAHAGPHTVLLHARGAAFAPGVELVFVNANRQAAGEPMEPLPGKVHYFAGPRSAWRTNVPTYARVLYRNLYPAIDLVWYGKGADIEYDLRLRPGADPSQVAMDAPGAILRYGEIVLGPMLLRRPVARQGRRPIPCRYVLHGSRIRFALGSYDRGRPLVIDPQVVYAGYLGGSGADLPSALATDRTGATYIAGNTVSPDFPTTPATPEPKYPASTCLGARPPTTRPCYSAFLTKLDAAGDAVVYSTYFGGTADTTASAIAVDGEGSAYIVLNGNSGVPLVNPLFSTGANTIVKLSPDGSAVVYSTMFPASVHAIAIDSRNSLYLTGSSGSSVNATSAHGFTPGASLFQTFDQGARWLPLGTPGGGALLMVFDPRQPTTLYLGAARSTDSGAHWQFLGGPQVLAVDPANSAVLYGAGPSAFQRSDDGGQTWINIGGSIPAAYGSVSRLVIDPKTPATVYAATTEGLFKSTDRGQAWSVTALMPQNIQDLTGRVFSLAVDPASSATLYAGTAAGVAKSTDGGLHWSPANNGLDIPAGGTGPTWIVIDPLRPSTLYAALTFAGAEARVYKSIDAGASWRAASAGLPLAQVHAIDLNPLVPSQLVIASDAGVFMTVDGAVTWLPIGAQLPYGSAMAAFQPVTGAVFAGLYSAANEDAFAAKLAADGRALLYFTYLGGTGADRGESIVVDAAGRAYIGGTTDSPDFPTAKPVQPRKAGSTDAFASVLSADGSEILFSTYLGQSSADTGFAIAADQSGNAYLLLQSLTLAYPSATVVKLDPAAATVRYSQLFPATTLGPIAVNPSGEAYLALPVLPPFTPGDCTGSSLLRKLNPAGETVYTLCLTGLNMAKAVSIDGNSRIVVLGSNTTPDALHPTPGAFQTIDRGPSEVVIVKVADTAIRRVPAVRGKR